MDIEELLQSDLGSFLIIEKRKSREIVVGVPHHAPAGVKSLPCPEHKQSDENAGHLGRYIADKLNSCSIIACNYWFDSNKTLESDYSKHIIKWNPKILVEIHGHAGKDAKADIEISSGSMMNNKYSTRLEELLRNRCSKHSNLKALSICGDFEKIYFKASSSPTITVDRWIPFHIELPSKLRILKNGKKGNPPSLGYEFCDCLVESVKEFHGELESRTSK